MGKGLKTSLLRKPPTSSKKTVSPKKEADETPKREVGEMMGVIGVSPNKTSPVSMKEEQLLQLPKRIDFSEIDKTVIKQETLKNEVKINASFESNMDSVKLPVNGTKVNDILNNCKSPMITKCSNSSENNLKDEKSKSRISDKEKDKIKSSSCEHDKEKYKNSWSSSSSSNTSQKHRSSSSSKYDCVKCYKRSKIKH